MILWKIKYTSRLLDCGNEEFNSHYLFENRTDALKSVEHLFDKHDKDFVCADEHPNNNYTKFIPKDGSKFPRVTLSTKVPATCPMQEWDCGEIV